MFFTLLYVKPLGFKCLSHDSNSNIDWTWWLKLEYWLNLNTHSFQCTQRWNIAVGVSTGMTSIIGFSEVFVTFPTKNNHGICSNLLFVANETFPINCRLSSLTYIDDRIHCKGVVPSQHHKQLYKAFFNTDTNRRKFGVIYTCTKTSQQRQYYVAWRTLTPASGNFTYKPSKVVDSDSWSWMCCQAR